MTNNKSFGELFRKYRLRAEFATFSQLGNAISEKGLIYEDSIFSHWQKGTRVPSRPTILKLIEIFLERQSMKTLQQANEFLEVSGEGYLTSSESGKMQFSASEKTPFQLPNQIDNFTGREKLIIQICKRPSSNIILIHGSAGVGKSSLAIKLGYLLKSKFPDGCLWFRLDTSDVMDILLSIAFAYGVDVGHIQDKEIRASIVRSILSGKKVLLLFDNAEPKNDLRLLLPNSDSSFVIITSRFTNLTIPAVYKDIFLDIFTKEETLSLFKTITGQKYINENKKRILQIADKIGFLPLALHIFAKELRKKTVTAKELLKQIENESITLHDFSYSNKNLYIAISLTFELLDVKTKELFLSLGVFDGKDFSKDAVAYINGLPQEEVKVLLDRVKNVSLVENSTSGRLRVHPVVKKFLREKLDNSEFFLKAAKYYEQFLSKFDKTFLKSYPNIKQESDNVIYIFKKCYQLHYWDQVIALWNPMESLLYATNQLSKMRYLFQIVQAQSTGINKFQKILIGYFCFLLIYWILLYFSGLKIGFWNYLYALLWGLIPTTGSIVGFLIARSWGLLKNMLGKSIFFLSAGLLSWGVGSSIWSYYNFFLKNPIPYPSYADFGYLPSYLFWALGIINLPHAIGGKFKFTKNKIVLFLIPVFVFMLTYYLLVFATRNNIFAPISSYLKFFFDIAYPVSDAIVLTIVLILGTSFKFMGGMYRFSIYSILLGFLINYIGDFLFSYTTTTGTYYNGSFVDLFFSSALALITFGILGFYHK